MTSNLKGHGRTRLGFSYATAALLAGFLAAASFQGGSAGASSENQSASVPIEIGNQLHVAASVSELPVPPTVPASGVCTNPTGCVSGNWGALGSPGFYWESRYVLLGVTYAGAPTTGPTSIYQRPQVVLEKTDGTKFPDGDAWKCITCGVTMPSSIVTGDFTYPPPHALPGDKQILVGNGILDCTSSTGVLLALTDPDCTPSNTQIYPIYWGSNPLGGPGGLFGNGREWRLSPDGVHLEWDSLLFGSTGIAEDEFEGSLTWDAKNQRYDLTNVYFLPQSTLGWVVAPGNQLVFQPQAMIGEARGWSSDGQSILGIQAYEDSSVDGWATSLATGASRPLTVHAEYTDPMQMSPNGKWMINDEVAGSGRMDWMSGLEGISPVTSNLLSLGDISQMRNDGNRRFFEPWLTSTNAPLTEQVNAAVADPNWNAAADPDWLADSTAVVWAENYACGANPTPHQCAGSPEPGGRNSRIMIGRLALPPSPAVAPTPISNTAPASWAIPYTGQALPSASPIPSGTYAINGNVFGTATVVITDNSTGTAIQQIQVTYRNYVQSRGLNVVNGTEELDTTTIPGDITWNDDIRVLGLQGAGSQVTSPGGFSININDLNFANNFQAVGTMTTTLNGQTYTQPANGS
jgi:hypothetical protein